MRFIYGKEQIPGVEQAAPREEAGKDTRILRRYFNELGRRLKGDCQIDVDALSGPGEAAGMAELCVKSIMQGSYRFSRQGLKRLEDGGLYRQRDSLILYPDCTVYLLSEENLEEAVQEACLAGKCAGYARMLGDLPGNYLHREEMCAYARELAEASGITFRLYGNRELRELGCGGILAVNRASEREAALLEMTYEGGGPAAALVGKGILFDSGGYHLKSMEGMEGMKYDMCGAADALSLLEYAAGSGLRLNLTAVLPLAENVIAPDGLKMGDVITTLSGKTVEVYNTDAEGRLLLCDALTFASRRAGTVLDLATLTLSCRSALGDEITGVFSNEDGLFEKLNRAAGQTGEKIWRMPLDELYHEQLAWSKTADLANYAPGKGGGAGAAAAFLEEFVERGAGWAHFDMVGPAVQRGDSPRMEAGATGAMFDTVAVFLKKYMGKW